MVSVFSVVNPLLISVASSCESRGYYLVGTLGQVADGRVKRDVRFVSASGRGGGGPKMNHVDASLDSTEFAEVRAEADSSAVSTILSSSRGIDER